jgi:acetylglutamate/LysW-gamma-L-alpha-aminoadipate kinase
MIIIKIGGNRNTNKQTIAREIAELDTPAIVVHGANEQRDDLAAQIGAPTKRITSPSGITSVQTDKQALDILIMAYAGLENTRWIQALQQAGCNAIGLTGADGGIWKGKRKKVLIHVEKNKKILIRDTYTGTVDASNTKLLELLITNGYTPVLTQPALSYDNELINTDNDLAIAAMTKTLPITKIVMLFGAPGFLKDPTDPTSIISHIAKHELPDMMQYAHGTMKKKIMGTIEALNNGVQTVYWGDSRREDSITHVLAGNGTTIS